MRALGYACYSLGLGFGLAFALVGACVGSIVSRGVAIHMQNELQSMCSLFSRLGGHNLSNLGHYSYQT